MSSVRNNQSVGDRPLPWTLNAATRSLHTELNRLILQLLTKALPPHASDPSTYVTGILHIAPIYAAFETALHQILDRGNPSSPADLNIDPTTFNILLTLRFPRLLRADQIRQDITTVTKWPPESLNARLRAVTSEGPLRDFVQHIRSAVEARPHILVAYLYIFYMALFAGGRHLRGMLESAGEEFWEGRGADALRFFYFDTEQDGEDEKVLFKECVATVQDRLPEQKVREIVEEGRTIFQYMLLLVRNLDRVCVSGEEGASDGERLPHLKTSRNPSSLQDIKSKAALATPHTPSTLSNLGKTLALLLGCAVLLILPRWSGIT